jgi:NTP pyrophosphatase (non-canonical NTP hydrolase)
MLNELTKEVHEIAKSKGWWDDGDRNFGEVIALIHSELSEAMEEYRKGKVIDIIDSKLVENGEGYYIEKPLGIPIELADVIIRVLDFCGRHDIDIDQAIKLKMAYNKTRPYRHGGKKA